MADSSGSLVVGRTRWRRFGLLFVPALGMVATVVVLMATGAVAIPIAISGTQFTVTATNLSSGTTTDRTEFIQYGAVDQSSGPVAHAVAVNVIKNATLTNLTQTVCAPLPAPLPGSLKVVLTANPAVATNLVVDATALTGDATFTNIQIGVPAPAGIPDPGAIGTFAQVADHVNINNLSQTALFTQAGTFTLTGLNLGASLVSTC